MEVNIPISLLMRSMSPISKTRKVSWNDMDVTKLKDGDGGTVRKLKLKSKIKLQIH